MLLRLRQILRSLPIGTGILHVRAKHAFVKIGVQVIVVLRDPFRPSLILHVIQASLERVQNELLIAHGFVEFDRMKPEKKLIEPIGVPPTLHVRLPESKRSLSQDAIVESIVVYQDIPRLGPIDVDLSLFEQSLNKLL